MSVVSIKHFVVKCVVVNLFIRSLRGEIKTLQDDQQHLRPFSVPTIFPIGQVILVQPKQEKIWKKDILINNRENGSSGNASTNKTRRVEDEVNEVGTMISTLQILFYAALAILTFTVILKAKNFFRSVRLAFILPGPTPLPILGNVLMLKDDRKLEALALTLTSIYGPLMRCWISVIPFFFVIEPEHLQVILGSNKHVSKNMFYKLMHTFLGEGLITNNGQKWRTNRKLIQPFFHINYLEHFITSFSENALRLAQQFEDNKDYKITQYINDCVLDILHETVLGISPKNCDQESPFRSNQLCLTERIVRPWLLLNAFFRFTSPAREEISQKKRLQNYARHILEKKRKGHIYQEAPKVKSLFDCLMEISESNMEFTDDDIVNEACTFMLAGQESVGSAIVFTLYFLAKNQDIQDRVRSELNRIFEDDHRPPSLDDLKEMKYLEQCIKETMRLNPSIPIVARKLNEDVIMGKYVFPTGSNLFITPFATHRLPHIYPDPLKFDPERFSPENLQKLHPYAYLPFSLGPRNCIGYKFAYLEMKTLLSTLLRHFRISLTQGHEEINLTYKITLRARGGVWLKFSKN